MKRLLVLVLVAVVLAFSTQFVSPLQNVGLAKANGAPPSSCGAVHEAGSAIYSQVAWPSILAWVDLYASVGCRSVWTKITNRLASQLNGVDIGVAITDGNGQVTKFYWVSPQFSLAAGASTWSVAGCCTNGDGTEIATAFGNANDYSNQGHPYGGVSWRVPLGWN